MLKNIGRRIKKELAGPAFRPDPEAHSFLASFPRSGNTWIRTVLFHYIYGQAPNDFDDVHFGVPDMYIRIPARRMHFNRIRDPRPIVVKTHDPYRITQPYQNVVYIVRDPRDAIPSYWKLVNRQQPNLKSTFDEFLLASVNGAVWPGSWLEHLSSWYVVGASAIPNLEVVRYEDLRAGDPAASARMARGLGLGDENLMHDLLQHYDFKRMKKIEQAPKRKNSIDRTPTGFVGRGMAQEEMKSRVEELVFRRCAWQAIMEEFGYERSNGAGDSAAVRQNTT